MFETDPWPYVPAKHIGPVRSGAVRVLVVHTAEWPEVPDSAYGLAKYAQNPSSVASWHINVSNLAIVQSVKDSRVAYAAPGCNHDGIQMELCCYAGQSAQQWRDPYSIGLIAMAADAAAQYCLKYNLPPRRLTDDQLLSGARGIVGHDQVSRVYRRSDHTDPGPNFPWPRFTALTMLMISERRVLA